MQNVGHMSYIISKKRIMMRIRKQSNRCNQQMAFFLFSKKFSKKAQIFSDTRSPMGNYIGNPFWNIMPDSERAFFMNPYFSMKNFIFLALSF